MLFTLIWTCLVLTSGEVSAASARGGAARGGRGARVLGGAPVAIEEHPYVAAALYSGNGVTFSYYCAASILTPRALLSAAQCYLYDPPARWQLRVGARYHDRGGALYAAAALRTHPRYDPATSQHDVAVVVTARPIAFGAAVGSVAIAGRGYVAAAGEPVDTLGWGEIYYGGSRSLVVRHAEMALVAWAACRDNYAALGGKAVLEDMLCAGDAAGGVGQCDGDEGAPLRHRGAVVGVASWRHRCGLPAYPAVNTRVAAYSDWIVDNADPADSAAGRAAPAVRVVDAPPPA